MYDRSQTTSLFTAAQSGLQSTLQYLFSNNTSGIDRTALNNAIYNNQSGINSTFFQMINSQFSTLDKDNNGTLNADEANNMLNDITTGLSRDQVLQLLSQGSIDKELANKIISNFSKMDTNGDGKVSEAEINTFCINQDIQAKQDEQKELTLKNMSLYYETDYSSSSDEEEV